MGKKRHWAIGWLFAIGRIFTKEVQAGNIGSGEKTKMAGRIGEEVLDETEERISK